MTGLGALLLTLPAVAPAQAGQTIPRLPRTSAAANTPRVVDDSTVTDAGLQVLRQVRGTMYAGGDVHQVLNSDGSRTYVRHNIFSFNAQTRRMTAWAPRLNGGVYAIVPSSNGRYLYIGGRFTSYNGHPVNHLVKYDRLTNRIDPRFRFRMRTSRISDLQVVGGRLFVAGNLPLGGLAAVNQGTGARETYFNRTLASGRQPGYSTRVYRFAVNRAKTKMVVLGSFTSIGGHPRQQAAMLQLRPRQATVSAWTSPRWNGRCSDDERFYPRDVDWSPAGDTFAVVTTGAAAPGTSKLCDTVSFWRGTNAGNQQPLWVNYSGGDTFTSVTVTNRAVFVSGHFRWLDNPQGHDSKGPGAVDRRGLAAVSRTTGRALAWNPSKSTEGGRGGYQLYFTDRGLWVAQYEKYLGTDSHGDLERHDGLGLLPY